MKTRRVVSALEDKQPTSQRWGELAKVAAEFKAFRPAPQVLTRVRAVPTIFPDFDRVTRVGGLPIERVTLLHGPSGSGKTYLTIGLLLSFLMRDHLAALIDAERTTPITWLEKAMGDHHRHPFFFADRPKTYEQTVDNVQAFVTKLKALRDAGKVSKDTSALLVVDSIRKLVPQDQWKTIMREVKASKDGKSNVRNRLAQIKAAMNATWLDDLVPLLEETQTAMVIIARETVDADAPPPRASAFRGKPEPTMKTGGGTGLFYDASLDLRTSRVKSYGKEVDGKFVSYGDLHRVDITKSKVSGKESYRAQCHFHISNGAFVPAGFDRGRDLVEVARRLDVVEGTGWLTFRKHRWRNEDAAVKALAADAQLFAAIEAECRALFKKEATRD